MEGFSYNKQHIPAYKKELKEKGYLYLKNFISPAKIKEAADVVDGCLIESGYLEKNGD